MGHYGAVRLRMGSRSRMPGAKVAHTPMDPGHATVERILLYGTGC